MSLPESPSPASTRTPALTVLTVPVQPGVTLVEASAGTGKTFALAGLVLRLVLDGRVTDLSRLLVVTFTNAATDELKARIRRALHDARAAFDRWPQTDGTPPVVAPFLAAHAPDDASRALAIRRLTTALAGADAAAVSTIHGFCQRELSRAAFASGQPFRFEYAEDDNALVARAAADAWHRLTHADARLAGLAVGKGWTDPKAFGEVFRALRRHPRATLAPTPPPLAETLDEVDAAARALADALDGTFGTAAAAIRWKSKTAFQGLGADEIERSLQTVADDPFGASSKPAHGATPDRLCGDCYKSALADATALGRHGVAESCGRLVRALGQIDHAAARASAEGTEAALAAIQRRRGVVTPDDLLRRLYDGLQPGPDGDRLAAAIASRYDAALVDEFQDTDPFQLAIFRRAFASRPTFFVGDPKQAIYAFRGADLFAYLGARREAEKDGQRFALGTNWRSASGVVEALNALFSGPERPFLYDGIPYEPVQPSPTADDQPLAERGPWAKSDLAGTGLVCWTFGPQENGRNVAKGVLEERLVQATVHEVRRLLAAARIGDRALRPGDIGIVTRTNKQAETMQAALRKAGVAGVVSRGGDVLEAAETGELERVLAAVLRPHEATAVRGALATELWGWDAAALAGLDADPAAWTALVDRLYTWQRLWRQHGVLGAVGAFAEHARVAARLLRYADGERRLTNLRHVAALLHRAETAAQRRPEDLLRWLAGRHTRSLAGRDEAELRLESDADAVQIATVHTAKGLEYGVLFAPYLCLGRQPNWTAKNGGPDLPVVHEGDQLVVDLGSDEIGRRRQAHEAETLAEAVRLAYVALTRAKHRAYTAWGPVNTAEHTGLGYLLAGHAAPYDGDPVRHAAIARRRAGSGHREALDALAARSTAIRLAPLPDAATGYAPGPDDASTRAPHGAARTLPAEAEARLRSRARASFTAWTHHAWAKPGASTERAGADERPAVADPDEPASPAARAPASEESAAAVEPESHPEADALAGLHRFAAGLEPGLCLHALLEGADLREPAGAANRRLTARTLALFGLADPAAHRRVPEAAPLDPAATALALLGRLADLPLPVSPDTVSEEPPGTLGALAPHQRAAEWRFVLPLGGFAPHALADAFARHAAPALQPYADALRTLRADDAEGLLSGTADLVCEWGGRYFLLDWKSNRLGDDDAAYAPDALAAAMQERHYVLQYHLYLVALDAHLRARLPGYRYDDHIGGVGYAFLRGAARPDRGLFADRPPRALVDALAQALRP